MLRHKLRKWLLQILRNKVNDAVVIRHASIVSGKQTGTRVYIESGPHAYQSRQLAQSGRIAQYLAYAHTIRAHYETLTIHFYSAPNGITTGLLYVQILRKRLR